MRRVFPGHEPTLLCAQIVDASISGRPARPALLEEISPDGAIISMECPAGNGATVNLDCATCELRGKVVGCHQRNGGYVAEIAFAAGEPWSPGRFFPEQGFNPKCLVCENPFCTPACTGECSSRTALISPSPEEEGVSRNRVGWIVRSKR